MSEWNNDNFLDHWCVTMKDRAIFWRNQISVHFYWRLCNTSASKKSHMEQHDVPRKRDKRNWIIGCIEMYKELPLLWKITNDEYRNCTKNRSGLWETACKVSQKIQKCPQNKLPIRTEIRTGLVSSLTCSAQRTLPKSCIYSAPFVANRNSLNNNNACSSLASNFHNII